MSKRSHRSRQHSNTPPATTAPAAQPDQAQGAQGVSFSFGDPVPVLEGRDILDHTECWLNGKWYEPPISMNGLAKAFRAGPHHSSALFFKRNMLASTFIPNRLLSREAFGRWALDELIFGNGYLERKNSMLRNAIGLTPPLAKYMRRGEDPDQFFMLHGWKQEHEFEPGTIFQLQEPDINQEIYGVPEYLSSLQSAWLNESATLFRRKYYNNGSHAGFIMYMTDPGQNEDDIEALQEAMKNAKGPGNFRNLFVYAPNGKKDGLQLIPVGEVAAKDEFFNIKNVSRDDILASHRIPPQLIGVVPSNAGGFGSMTQAAQVYAENELKPLQRRFEQLNDWMGEEVVRFEKYELAVAGS
ncbi:MAG: phage portal protein [Halopseudomonas sp.]|uniref:phage portal protein n=1 Tax=Halopseudomonas sp. TaxID=2901191 RepID=UPI0030017768